MINLPDLSNFISEEIDNSITNELQNLSDVLNQGNNAANLNLLNVGTIGVGTLNPESSAALEIHSTSQGFLLPRMNYSKIDSILNPAVGLMVFNIENSTLQIYNGSSWQNITTSSCIPNAPETITGLVLPYENQTNVTYSIDTINGVTNFNWIVPNDASILSGQGTTSIIVNFGSLGGNISVRSENPCGNSEYTNLNISIQPDFICGDQIGDIDGNVYNTVLISSQCWMKDNLKTTHYGDGTELVNGIGVGNISGDYTTKYYFYYNDSSIYADTYGLLYTWAAVMNDSPSSSSNPSNVQGVCPDSWHIPSDNEWFVLEKLLGMAESDSNTTSWRGTYADNVGGKLKEAGTMHWISPNEGATNEKNFTALPAGAYGYFATLPSLGSHAFFWSSTRINLRYKCI